MHDEQDAGVAGPPYRLRPDAADRFGVILDPEEWELIATSFGAALHLLPEQAEAVVRRLVRRGVLEQVERRSRNGRRTDPPAPVSEPLAEQAPPAPTTWPVPEPFTEPFVEPFTESLTEPEPEPKIVAESHQGFERFERPEVSEVSEVVEVVEVVEPPVVAEGRHSVTDDAAVVEEPEPEVEPAVVEEPDTEQRPASSWEVDRRRALEDLLRSLST